MVDALELSQILTTKKIEKQTNLNGKRGIMSLDVQTALYILSLLGKRGVMRVNKISYVVLSGLTRASQKYIKHQLTC